MTTKQLDEIQGRLYRIVIDGETRKKLFALVDFARQTLPTLKAVDAWFVISAELRQ